MVSRRILNAALCAALVTHNLLGCAAEVGSGDELDEELDEELDVVVEPILNGFNTTAVPAVGRLVVGGGGNQSSGACTATLISSRVILSAAHCFSFDQTLSNLGTQLNPPINSSTGVNAIFTMFNGLPPAGQTAEQQVHVKRVFVLGNALGEKDIAIAELVREVDAGYAPPLKVATSIPAQGANVTGMGFGCTKTGEAPPGNKTQHGGTWQAATHNTIPAMGCKGDSGGPILDSSNRIVAIFSGPGPNGTDLNARVVTHRAVIDRINAIYGNMQVCTTCPVINLRTSNGVNFLQAPFNGGQDAVINALGWLIPGEWEQFRFVQFARQVPAPIPSWAALQTRSGRWVGTPGNGSGNVRTSRGEIFDNEMFFVENRGSGKWSFKTNSFPTRFFLTAEGGGGGVVSSNRTAFVSGAAFGFPFP